MDFSLENLWDQVDGFCDRQYVVLKGKGGKITQLRSLKVKIPENLNEIHVRTYGPKLN